MKAIKNYIRKFSLGCVNAVRHVRNPEKYKSIDFLYSLLDDKTVKLNDKAINNRKIIIPFICFGNAVYIFKNSAAYVTNEKEAKSMIRRGVALLITDKDYEDYPCMVCDNPLDVIYRLSRYYKDLSTDTRTVAVTGSIGKTTTKDMIGVVCKTFYKTYYSLRSENCLDIIAYNVQHIPKSAEVFLQEVTENVPDGGKHYSYILMPDLVVITSIEQAHFEIFGSYEKIVENTCTITQNMAPDGKVVVNVDEFDRFDLLNGRKVITVSTKTKDADYYAENIKMDERGLTFDVIISISKEQYRVRLYDVFATHNVICAISAFAAGVEIGVPPTKAVEGLARYRTTGVRQNVFTSKDGVLVYADCFNAVTKSVKSAVNTCDLIPVKGRRIVIIGDIEEAGELTESSHKEVIECLAQSKFDTIFTVGSKMKKAVDSSNISQTKQVDSFDNVGILMDKVHSMAKTGDLVLLKGSHAINLEKCIEKYWPKEYKERCLSINRENHRHTWKSMFY